MQGHDDVLHAGLAPIAPGAGDEILADVAGHELGLGAVHGLHRQGHGGGGVAGEHTHLQRAAGAHEGGERLHQGALLGADLHHRPGVAGGVGPAAGQGRVLAHADPLDVGLDRFAHPQGHRHGPSSFFVVCQVRAAIQAAMRSAAAARCASESSK